MKNLLTLLFATMSVIAFGQITHKHDSRCGHNIWMEEMLEEDPEYLENIQVGFRDFQKGEISEKRSSSIITVPVHVIIVHPPGQAIGTGVNFSVEHVQSQIDVINQDFGRYNSDAGNTPAVFPAADTGIQFCLATVDPDGNPTDGITRYATNTSMANTTGRTEVIAASKWPRETYMNIWSAPNLPFLGLATVPGTGGLPNSNQDFILVESTTFGGPGYATFAPYHLGRTTTHEVGHWFGLFHVWGTGNGGCVQDDGISDTPIQNTSNGGCPDHPSPSCGNSGDMFMNYMDYVNDNCMNAFTQEQGEYMNTILSTSRASLQGAASTACNTVVPLVLTVINQQDPNCSDSFDGFILVEAGGGSPNYTYSIDGSTFTSDPLFTDLEPGTHTIEVFDADGSTTSVTVFLNAPLPLSVIPEINTTNTCQNDTDGSVSLTTLGGTAPYQYSLNSGSTQSSNTFDNLSDGFYAYTIVDINGCIFSDIFELESMDAIIISVDSTYSPICADSGDGFIISSAEGGQGPISYSLDNENFQDDGEFNDLSGGQYYVYVQDSIGCYDSLEVILTEPDSFYIDALISAVNCNGDNTGSISIQSFGGNGEHTYSLDGMTYGDSTVFDSLYAGDYIVYTLDSLDCQIADSIIITEPSPLTLSVDSLVESSCFGAEDGSVYLLANGGSEPYMYILGSDTTATGVFENILAGNYTASVIDSNLCESEVEVIVNFVSTITVEYVGFENISCNGLSDGSIEIEVANTQGDVTYSLNGGAPQSDPSFQMLSAGEYTIIITDETGCDAAAFATLTEPEVLELSVTVLQDVTCFGGEDGQAMADAIGGTPPYFFQYDIMNPSQLGLIAGNYNMTVTDENGCADVVPFEITEPDEIIGTVSNSTEVDCDTNLGGGFTVAGEGGAEGAYIYAATGSNGTTTSETGIFTDMAPGSYDVVITDEKGCEGTVGTVVSLENMFSAQITDIRNIKCFGGLGGELTIEIIGGMGDKTYLLDNAEEVDPSDLSTHAGEHILSITDENGCMIELFFTLTEPEELSINYDINTESDILTLNGQGGVAPYMYSFDNAATFSDENNFDLTEPGDLTVFLIDANDCVSSLTLSVTDVTELQNDWNIRAFPNPFRDQVTMSIDLPQDETLTIEVFDLRSKAVHKILEKKYNSGENIVKLDLFNFASSIYIVKIASAEGYRYIKVTKT